jgi:hypothetical protein
VKSILSAIESEILGPFTRLVVPGTIVVGSALFAFISINPGTQVSFSDPLVLFGATCAILFTGMAIESLASHIESHRDGKFKNVKTRKKWGLEDVSDVIEEWYRYLRLSFEIEPVGHRYLRPRVIQLKFELNAGVSFLFGGFSLLVAMAWKHPFEWEWLGWLSVLLCMGWYLLWEAHQTQVLLVRTRHEVLKGLRKMPEDPPKLPTWGPRLVHSKGKTIEVAKDFQSQP